MNNFELFTALPIWGFFLFTMLLALFSVEIGYQWARHKRRAEVEKEAPVGAMVGATLGLLAFLLAITFGKAEDHFNARKITLLDEANAIRTTYLLAKGIPEPHGVEVRKLLCSYVEERLQWSGLEKGHENISARTLLNQLWVHAMAVEAQNPGGVDVFLDTLGEVTRLHEKEVMVRQRNRISDPFWAALYAIAFLGLASMGYHSGVAGTNRSPVSVAVAISFSIVIMLIVDLDRPGEGFININMQAMTDVRDFVNNAKQ